MGEEDSHVMSQERVCLKRKSGSGRGVCSPGNGISKDLLPLSISQSIFLERCLLLSSKIIKGKGVHTVFYL